MPQIGQLPGPFRTISGCMGHVQRAAAEGGGIGRTGSASGRGA
jgi:hypothetical protein